MNIEIPLRFVNEEQEQYFLVQKRNSCFSGGYGNGKTHILTAKDIFLSTVFPKYRSAIVRRIFKDLRRTTMATFFNILPQKLIERRSDLDGSCTLTNGSEFLFIGLDNFSEKSLKSLEVNTVVIDQAEELDENIYIHLDSRVGRWSNAEIPESLSHLPFPINEFTHKQMPPSYMMLGCNPDSIFHWIYRRYHNESIEFQNKYKNNHTLINCPSTHNPALNKETLTEMLKRDPEWVRRFVYGEWGITDATIHKVLPDSIIDPPIEWIQNFLQRSRLYRVLDHGDASPTCCLWFAVWDRYYICYREYYAPNRLISEHRKAIEELSGDEQYSGNYSDPSIFHLNSQKNGGRWSIKDEYLDKSVCSAKPIAWIPADNNEFQNRNRINELLRFSLDVEHPVTKDKPSPLLYFIKRTPAYPSGCYHTLMEIQQQKRELLGYEDGKPIYSDEREESIKDHAYDCVRYFASIKAIHKEQKVINIPKGSFFDLAREIKKRNQILKFGLPGFAA